MRATAQHAPRPTAGRHAFATSLELGRGASGRTASGENAATGKAASRGQYEVVERDRPSERGGAVRTRRAGLTTRRRSSERDRGPRRPSFSVGGLVVVRGRRKRRGEHGGAAGLSSRATRQRSGLRLRDAAQGSPPFFFEIFYGRFLPETLVIANNTSYQEGTGPTRSSPFPRQDLPPPVAVRETLHAARHTSCPRPRPDL